MTANPPSDIISLHGLLPLDEYSAVDSSVGRTASGISAGPVTIPRKGALYGRCSATTY